MLLKCVNTGSRNGNCYILENDVEALILDAGVRYKDVLKALDYTIKPMSKEVEKQLFREGKM